MGRDHFVSQFYIKSFANSDGSVFCLDKRLASIEIPTQPTTPRRILWKKNLDQLLDNDLYRPIENAFAPILASLSREPDSTIDQPGFWDIFKSWAAAQHTRTKGIYRMIRHTLKTREPSLSGTLLIDRIAQCRHKMYLATRALFDQPRFGWVVQKADRDAFVLTDHPVCNTSFSGPFSLIVFAPLSPRLIFLGGSREDIRSFESRCSLNEFNKFALGWAEQYIYSGNRNLLSQLQIALQSPSEHGPLGWEIGALQDPFDADIFSRTRDVNKTTDFRLFLDRYR